MKNKGFALLEVIVAVGITAIFIPAIGVMFALGLQASMQGETQTKAYALAQEGMEAIYYIKGNSLSQWDWSNTKPENTAASEYYQPLKSGTDWLLGTKTTKPSLTESLFTRKIQILPIKRSGGVMWNSNKCFSGTIDNSAGASEDRCTRRILVSVSWMEKGEEQSISYESLVTWH